MNTFHSCYYFLWWTLIYHKCAQLLLAHLPNWLNVQGNVKQQLKTNFNVNARPKNQTIHEI